MEEEEEGPWPWRAGGKFHTYAFLFRTGRSHAHAAPPKGLLLVHVSPTRDTVSPFQEEGG